MIERLRVRIPVGTAGEFSPEFSFCTDCHSVSVPPPVLSLWHVKDPRSFCQKKCKRQVTPKHAYTVPQPTKSKWADYAVQAECENLSHELTRNSSWNARPQLSQLAEPLWILTLRVELVCTELISTVGAGLD